MLQTRRARLIAAGALVIIALIAFFAFAPSPSADLESIQADASLNAASTESAPQQQVANGWAANDLLTLIAEQDAANGRREAALLLVLVLLGGAILVSRPGAHADKVNLAPAPDEPFATGDGTPVPPPVFSPAPTTTPPGQQIAGPPVP